VVKVEMIIRMISEDLGGIEGKPFE
jgi:hypothetical protein